MKYGATLRAHSIPAWGHHNIDYDDIKHFIKENTTPGKGKTMSIPGMGDVRGRELEDALYTILSEQCQRINLFVKSKAGEIKRRLDHLEKQIAQLSARGTTSSARIPAKRLERYGKLENDVLKAGEDLRCLSRFVAAQQTAFKKLLKKHKKWTGSTDLELRFNKEVLNDPSSFTAVGLEPLLVQWEETLHAVRTLYEDQIGGSGKLELKQTRAREPQVSLQQLTEILQRGSQVHFDTFTATLPLSDAGKNAVYWVHPDNVVELQVLLLQHTRSHSTRRQSTPATPTGSLSRNNSFSSSPGRFATRSDPDTGLLIIDDESRFVTQQSSTTLEAQESSVGVSLQNSIVGARWTKEDEAIVAAALDKTKTLRKFAVKRKHMAAVFDPDSAVSARKAYVSGTEPGETVLRSSEVVEEFRTWMSENPQIKPLATVSATRQRFVDIAADSTGFILATLDKSIGMKRTTFESLNTIDTVFSGNGSSSFPFAVLRVRQEGSYNNNLISVLESSHLVERVRGFSLEYHAVWHCCRPANVVAPFWIPLMQKDIRKLPRVVTKRSSSRNDLGYGSQSATPQFSSNTSAAGDGTGDTTAVEGRSPASTTVAEQLQTPPLSSFKKKRTRGYPRPVQQQPSQAKYWSEYDHPEESEDDNAYVLYVDPNAESTLSQAWRNLRSLFRRRQKSKHNTSLATDGTLEAGPSEDDSLSSSDDELLAANRAPQRRSYGTLGRIMPRHDASNQMTQPAAQNEPEWLPQLTVTCLGASIAILICGFILAATGRRKQASEVDAGIIFAVISSLLFAISGVASMFGRGYSPLWTTKVFALGVLAVDAIASGGLLAWILG
ncbi:hypothetical protein MBLNU459_g6280t1 [Dothideomycetes sp. NU459]